MGFVINGVAYSTEDFTVSDDLSVGDDATITDALTVGGNITLTAGGSIVTTANGNVSIVPNGTGVFYCGAGTPGHLTPTSGEAYFQGKVEFDSTVYFDASSEFNAKVGFNSGAVFIDNQELEFGNASDATIFYGTAQTPDALIISLSSDSNLCVICEKADRTYDFAHAQPPKVTEKIMPIVIQPILAFHSISARFRVPVPFSMFLLRSATADLMSRLLIAAYYFSTTLRIAASSSA